MARPTAKSDAMPAFRNAAEKREWLLAQLAAVEREALLEEMAAGRNERVTIRLHGPFRVEVGNVVLYEGPDAAEFTVVLSQVVDALPLGSAFVVEAARGGKALSGGLGPDEGAEPEHDGAGASSRRTRRPRLQAA